MDAASIAVAFVAGFIVAWTLKVPTAPRRTIKQPGITEDGYRVAANQQRKFTKQQRKLQIIECVDMNGSITSREVEEIFGVSSATATRYLSELSQEGKINKHGKGRSVHYKL